jgi:hypothetical protein
MPSLDSPNMPPIIIIRAILLGKDIPESEHAQSMP